jgi:hypothetical protein
MIGKYLQTARRIALFGVGLGTVLAMQTTSWAQRGEHDPEYRTPLANLRKAALAGERFDVKLNLERMSKQVEHLKSLNSIEGKTLLHAFAQEGITEALPLFDEAIRHDNYQTMKGFARVKRARLVAESVSARLTDDPARRAVARMRRFLLEIGMTAAQINAVAEQPPDERNFAIADGTDFVEPERYVLREIADLVYRNPTGAAAALPEVQALNFAADFPSALKMRLAPLTRAQRVAWLVNDLAHKAILREEVYYEYQLAVDEGPVTSRAIAEKLKEMDAHREDYPVNGYCALFAVLLGIGDKADAAVVEPYLHDSDPRISRDASVWGDIKAGYAGQHMPGY